MASTTPNLGLTKPDVSEFYDIELSNNNLDRIDKAIGEIEVTDMSASKVAVTDAGNYYTSDNVEGSLQEIGFTLNAMRGSLIATTNAILGS